MWGLSETPILKPKFKIGKKVIYTKDGRDYIGTIVKSELKNIETGYVYMIKLEDDYLTNKNIIVRETKISLLHRNTKNS
jgi:RNA polymerase-interacting CarD/CdnL/TRCF family regulator